MTQHLLLDAIGTVVLLFVLIALLPRFDSTADENWGDDQPD